MTTSSTWNTPTSWVFPSTSRLSRKLHPLDRQRKLPASPLSKNAPQLEIVFPRVAGYRVDLPEERLTANFTEDSTFVLTPEMVGPGQTLMEGIVGEGVMISAAEAQAKRPSTIAFDLAKLLLYKYFKDEEGEPKMHLFYQIQTNCPALD